MRFDILTIFPALFSSPLEEGILRRARASGAMSVHLHNIRDAAVDRHKMTDDRPFGGGEGMVMKADVLASCLHRVREQGPPGPVILLSPRGRRYTHAMARELAAEKRLILVCGRYEGVDERFCRRYVDSEISIGDYVLTGGELAAMVIVDSVTRLLPGVLGCADSARKDSFSRGLLKHPQYTRPREFEGMTVPAELLSGDHARIREYRFLESVRVTLERRPELLAGVEFSREEMRLLRRSGLADRVERYRTGHEQ